MGQNEIAWLNFSDSPPSQRSSYWRSCSYEAVDRLRRDVEAGHDRGVHRGEVQFADAFIDPDQRLVGEAALIREEQLGRGFEPLRLALVPGDQDVLLYSAG